MAIERKAQVLAIVPSSSSAQAGVVSSFVDVAALGRKEVGNRVRLYRKLQNLTQEDLAQRAGVTQVDISRLENTPSKTPLRVFSAVCEALGISIADLLEDAPIVVDGSVRPADAERE